MYIYLDIVEQFSCAMCGACCRRQWLVTVDERSYRRNEAWFAGRGRETEFRRAFVAGQGGEPGEYAAIARRDDGRCWFLTDDNKCFLHKEAGHAHLDTVCQCYPRYPVKTARGLELSLSFSCPAALALADRTAPLAVVRAEHPPVAVPPDSYAAAVFPAQQPPGSPLRYYFEIEQHLIDLVQYRGLALAERVAMVAETAGRLALIRGQGLLGAQHVGEELNKIFRGNYALLDQRPAPADGGAVTPEIILEHYFVSLIFKKLFYIYGLGPAARLLQDIWRQAAGVCGRAGGDRAVLDGVRALIIDSELQYGHNRRELLRRLGGAAY